MLETQRDFLLYGIDSCDCGGLQVEILEGKPEILETEGRLDVQAFFSLWRRLVFFSEGSPTF